jgi:hypothetical protein
MNNSTILTAGDDRVASPATSWDPHRGNGAGFRLARAASGTHLVHRYLVSL